MTGLFLHELRRLLRGRGTARILAFNVFVVSTQIWSVASHGMAGAFQARKALASLTVAELAIGLVVAPFLSASAIALERERNTLDSLLGTPNSRFAIVSAKAFARFTYMFLFFLAPLPCIATLTLYGASSFTTIVAKQIVLLTALVGAVAIGVLASRFTRSSWAAALWALVGVALWNAAFPLSLIWGLGLHAIGDRLCPFILAGDAHLLHSDPSAVAAYVSATAALTVAALGLAATPIGTRRQERRRRRPVIGPAARLAILAGKRDLWPFHNPVLWRSLLTAEFGGVRSELLLFTLPIAAMAIAWIGSWRNASELSFAIGAACVALGITVPLSTARCIRREVERGTMASVAASSIPPWYVANGKLFGSFIAHSPVVAGVGVCYALHGVAGNDLDSLTWLPVRLVNLAAWVVLLSATSLAVSFATRSSGSAVLRGWLCAAVFGVLVAGISGASNATLESTGAHALLGPGASWTTAKRIVIGLLPTLLGGVLIGGIAWSVAVTAADRLFGELISQSLRSPVEPGLLRNGRS